MCAAGHHLAAQAHAGQLLVTDHHAMALHADRDLGLHTDELDLFRSTERAETLIEAGFDPRSSQD